MQRDDDELRGQQRVETLNQCVEAVVALDLPDEAFIHFPYPSLDDLVGGGIGPGEVWFICAFSGNGKTTFVMSLLTEWAERDERIYVMGFESSPAILRTHWACRRLGISPGDALSGKLRKTEEGRRLRELLKTEIQAQLQRDNVRFCPAPFANRQVLRDEMMRAADLGMRVVIIDHIDHIQPDRASRSNLYQESVATLNLTLELAQHYGLRVLSTSQLNNNAVRGDRLEQFLPPRPEAVYMGPNKRMIASGMIGLYRPLRLDLTEEELKAARKGLLQPTDFLQTNRMGVVLMKDRKFGREGRRCLLEVRNGVVREIENERWVP